ncbi:hypothetical protein MWH03_00280 [Klebsiella pneumoniae]|nr:hypothetical protein [Klebsiella pneumoniae]
MTTPTTPAGEALQCPENIACWSVDSVAECIDGLSEAAYRTLWNDHVPNVTSPDPDAPPPTLEAVWSLLSPAIQSDIIAGAKTLEEEEEAWREKGL